MAIKFRRIMWLQPDISLEMFVSQVNGLEKLGASVLPVDYRDEVLKLGISRAQEKILGEIDSYKPDLILASFFQNNYELSPEFLKKIPPKAPLVVITGDDEIYRTWQTIYFAQSANAVMTTDFAGRDFYEKLSIPVVSFQIPYLDFTESLPVEEKTIDVSFIGDCGKADRSIYINFLKENGINVEAFGRGSENSFVSRNEYLSIISKSKVNLNFTKVDVPCEIVKKEPWRAYIKQLKGRALEIPGMKSFFLSEISEDIGRIFSIGSEVDVFHNKEELLSKVKFYLKNNEKREKMASLAFERVKRGYTALEYLGRSFDFLYEKLRNNKRKHVNSVLFRSFDFNASEVQGNFFIFIELLKLGRPIQAFSVVPHFIRFDLSCLAGLWRGMVEVVKNKNSFHHPTIEWEFHDQVRDQKYDDGKHVETDKGFDADTDLIFEKAGRFLDDIFPARKIERILFVTPPDVDSGMFNYNTAKRGRYPNYPPYGFGLLATHLKKEGVEVGLLNLNNLILKACKLSETIEDFDFEGIWKKALQKKLAEFNADLIGVTCMFTQTHRSLSQVCSLIKKIAPSVPLAVGGVHITNSLANKDSTVQLINDLDVELLFLYEADVAFQQFVRVVNQKDPLTSLSQVVFNTGEKGLIRVSGRRAPEGEELDAIPAYELINPTELSKWGKVGSYTGLVLDKQRFATVLANRGCRAQCTFCSVRTFNGAGVRRRSVESVVDELLMLKEVYGIEHIMWLDDDLLYDRVETLKLFEKMIQRNINITWDCTNGVIVSAVTEEIIAAAADSGCIGLNLGMESGNDEILKSVKKPGTVENFLKGAEILRRFPKIFTKVFIIIGFPGETYRQQMDTIEVTREMGMDWHLLQVLQPLPNTPIFNSMLEDGLINPKDFEAIHNTAGAYGKISENQKRDLLGSDFKNAFDVKNLDTVVPREEFDNIWAYMNYHQNYKPLLNEQRPEKIKQKSLHLRHIYEVIAPNDAMAIFYAGYLHKRIYGKADEYILSRLHATLHSSPYWKDRFLDFDLSIHQIQ